MTSSPRLPAVGDLPVRITPERRLSDRLPPAPSPLPHLPFELPPPDLSPWLKGNTDLPGVHRFTAVESGPHVALTALMHGNEYAGAIVLADLLRARLRPHRGTLSLIFLNLEAFARFSCETPIRSRFVEEDMNRLWTNRSVSSSQEQRRVHQLLPYIETVDTLLDLHSMLWPGDPLLLAGPSPMGAELAADIGTPPLVVIDGGHMAGPRLIDMPHFTRPHSSARACLLEAGQHWSLDTLDVTRATVKRFLSVTGVTDASPRPVPASRIVHVTHRVLAQTGRFTFTQPYCSGTVIPERNTLIATDGPDEIRTPYDNCMLVMPNFRTARTHTAVRLARFEN
ncbi:succinylglutamate desuccinylase/aspartoacylase family protein [Acetobacter estunensis]|uniref:succinylglutamate desuccinylase/aspartoacylase domain-containing protein n=1 Tax=Acetobacter estunensis TaxID=104097 RepID=UPI0020C254BF|nr:succinylglutamate desuccinylase/aspartoacylase family protein [Acetobacter estunensis]